ncbi:MAG: 30S ribosomal protein S17e [Thaumarchaeota archaeon]|nr:MAG: 30S ribosomal protein S17e [Nitrososphaerota archaeon]
MDRIRRISQTLLQRYPDRFTTDFEKNKEVLSELTIISSKTLRNHIAGYITKTLKTGSEEKEVIEAEAQAVQ